MHWTYERSMGVVDVAAVVTERFWQFPFRTWIRVLGWAPIFTSNAQHTKTRNKQDATGGPNWNLSSTNWFVIGLAGPESPRGRRLVAALMHISRKPGLMIKAVGFGS